MLMSVHSLDPLPLLRAIGELDLAMSTCVSSVKHYLCLLSVFADVRKPACRAMLGLLVLLLSLESCCYNLGVITETFPDTDSSWVCP